MNGGNLFSVLISTVKTRFAAITSRIRLWTSWNFIQARIITGIRMFFTKLFDVRPKNKDDYFTIFGWMVSKRLASMIIIVAGVISIWYIVSVKQVFSNMPENGGMRTYKYNSVGLRLAKDKVRILGKSGYLAYEGNVEKGYVKGDGTLMDPEGTVVYQGQFEKNMYEGNGKEYYPSGTLKYEGQFHQNLYEGEGRQYREDGSVLYNGSFSQGLKNGEGVLCGADSSKVYEGTFASDEIVYSTFLGKDTEEANEVYSGERRIWQGGNEFCVYMKDIGAMYVGKSGEDSLDEKINIDSVYVLSNEFAVGTDKVQKLSALTKSLGAPIYEGNSKEILPEAVAVDILQESGRRFDQSLSMNSVNTFSDVVRVDSYDTNNTVYLTSYASNGLVYTFVSDKRDGTFDFYCIEKAENPEGQ